MNIRTAFILGAGLGTRLRPLTQSRPKLLVPIFGEPLIFRTLDYLLDQGISRFVINTHHLPHVFDRFFGGHHGEFSYRGAPLHLIYEPVPLETAGGLRNARQWLGEDAFLVVNGDVLTNIPLMELLKSQEKEDHCVILGLRSGPPQVGMDERTGNILDFYHKLGIKGLSYFLFTGLYILQPEIYRWIPPEGPVSMMSVFWQLLHAGKRISSAILDSGFWCEVGSRNSYLVAHQELAHQVNPQQRIKTPLLTGVELRGVCAVGKNCEIEPGAVLEDTIIWDDTKISSRSHLQRCIVCDKSQVDGNFSDCDFL